MKQSMRRLKKYRTGVLTVAILLVILLLVDSPAYAAKEHPVRLRIPFPETEGFTMTDENGNRSGLVVDYLYEIAKYTGWSYEFIDTDANVMVQDFIAGQYDLMGGTYYSEAFEQYFAYPDYSCGNTKAVLLARQDNDAIKGYDLRDFNGKTIGVVKQAADNVRRLEEFLSFNGLVCTIRPYTAEDVASNQINLDLEAGIIDLKLGNATDDIGEFLAVPAYFHPLYCIGYEDGDHAGLIPELLEKITARYGIQFSYILSDSYAHTQQLVIEGKADMAGIFFDDAADAMRSELIQTKPYAALNDLIVRNRTVTYPADGLTCGLLEGRCLPTYIKASEVIYFTTIDEVLSAVNTGKVDFACGLSARVEKMMQENIYTNVVPVTLSANRMNISFAMPVPAKPELLSIINKGINSLSEDDRISLLDHNLVSIGNAKVSV